MRLASWTTALVVAAAALGGCSGDDEAAAPPPVEAPTGPTTYLALGDSVAAGVGAPDPASGGYVPLLAEGLRQQLGCAGAGAACSVELRNLAVSGATAQTVVRDQLPVALGVLRSGAAVSLVTLTVGGNDVFVPVLRACGLAAASPQCTRTIESSLTSAEEGLQTTLRSLVEAAPVTTSVAVMTYYDPIPACRLSALGDLADRVLEGDGDSRGLNDVIRDAAEEHGAGVVETADALGDRADFVGGDDCLHPSGTGHQKLAQAFLGALT